jgi:uncharacterized membrane protein
VFAAVGDDTYNLLLVLHLLTVIIGFGTVFLAGVYGVNAKRRGGREGLAIAEATYDVNGNWAAWFIYAVPITGIILILVSDDVWKFSQEWISFSLLVYIVALGIVHGAHLPNIRRMNALMAELTAGAPPSGGSGGPPPQVSELEQRGRRAAMLGGLLNLLTVVAVVLMVFKPGL